LPVTALKTTPFEIAWGAHIWAKVIAINVYGESAVSEPGNTAYIITYADTPLSF
jgi:hypothetical protein